MATPIRMRPATEADHPFLSWLAEACMRDYAVALWGTWRSRTIEEQPLDGCRIIVDGGEPIGCVTTIVQSDHIWIDQLYISPAFQGKGIGGMALRTVLSEAARTGVAVRLSVLATNPAIDFYLSHGMRVHEKTAERTIMTT
ncbi:GNAT family N-acetyltransferase [Marinivivus vitaminiproducens]|uniref:GNAT family N-acetyltransferase n=1 Tax=Marinivivus vitaminiproducens TaxID=3035935 RepID=UPI00279FCC20|nr:GNAT family N-acetyltransferase [Geminicoccaceae bacterium SCSIO 64248]